jgi:hypothetical protein
MRGFQASLSCDGISAVLLYQHNTAGLVLISVIDVLYKQRADI